MSDWISPTISGLFDLLGGGLNAIYSAGSARKQYKYNLALQHDAQKHQINMFKHQHQWAVQDLRNAGLNPILSTHASSSMPSSGMNSVSMPSSANFDFKNSAKAIDRAIWKRAKKENQLLDEQIANQKSQTDANSALASKYITEAMYNESRNAFEFSPEMKELKKRDIYAKGTTNLSQLSGHFLSRIDNLTGFNPWSAYENSLNGKVKIKVIPSTKSKNHQNSSLSRLK